MMSPAAQWSPTGFAAEFQITDYFAALSSLLFSSFIDSRSFYNQSEPCAFLNCLNPSFFSFSVNIYILCAHPNMSHNQWYIYINMQLVLTAELWANVISTILRIYVLFDILGLDWHLEYYYANTSVVINYLSDPLICSCIFFHVNICLY